MEYNIRRYARFFAAHDIKASGSRAAIDLGAGCGFGALALAGAGFHVTAVDFSEPMLFQYFARMPAVCRSIR